MTTLEIIREMPKIELHVHLEGSIRPETLLKLAERHGVELPARDVAGLQEWYTFRDFPHFVEIYVAASRCVKTPEDIELIAREFAEGQKAQNILHSEVTYTASTIRKYAGIPWDEQRDALRRATNYAKEELGISMGFILDIVRGADTAESAMEVAGWVKDALGDPAIALGFAGIEMSASASVYREAFDFAHASGVPVITHAGETKGAESVWDVLEHANPLRIGHGIRCLEDPSLVAELRNRQIPLEVCPSSNVCLSGVPTFAEHPLPELLNEGLYVTVNSDDPPMFNTTLTRELERCHEEFDFSPDILWSLTQNALRASLLSDEEKVKLGSHMRENFPA